MNDTLKNTKLDNIKGVALADIYKKYKAYKDDGFDDIITYGFLKKKLCFLEDAKTVADVNELMKSSEVRFDGNKFVPISKYHIDEEEAMMWSYASLTAPLNDEATKRYICLVEKLLDKKIQ